MQLFSRSGDPFHTPLAKELFRVTAMRGLASATPLYVYHGTFEWWVPAAGTREFVAEQCRLGVSVDYHEYPAEHFGSAFMGFPDALSWLDEQSGRSTRGPVTYPAHVRRLPEEAVVPTISPTPVDRCWFAETVGIGDAQTATTSMKSARPTKSEGLRV